MILTSNSYVVQTLYFSVLSPLSVFISPYHFIPNKHSNSTQAPTFQSNIPFEASTISPFSPFSSSPQIPRAAADTNTSRPPHPTYSECKTTDSSSALAHFQAQIATFHRTDSDNESISHRSMFYRTAEIVLQDR